MPTLIWRKLLVGKSTSQRVAFFAAGVGLRYGRLGLFSKHTARKCKDGGRVCQDQRHRPLKISLVEVN